MLPDDAEPIAAAFGLGRRVATCVLAGRGEQGRVWRLETDRGPYAVKELFHRHVEETASQAAGFTEAVAAAGTVHVPLPLRTVDGRILHEPGGPQIRAYSWEDLLPVDTSLDAALVGATVAAVHRIEHQPAAPVHPWYTDGLGRARWDELLQAARGAGAPFADDLADEIPYLLELEELLERPTHLQACHRDLWADNVVPTPDGGVCVIDWDGCGLEDPAHELPMVLTDFAFGDVERLRTLYGAYLDAGGPGRVRRRGTFTMVIAEFGHFWEAAVVEYTRSDADDLLCQHSLGRVQELMQRPFRVQHVDDILDALSGLG